MVGGAFVLVFDDCQMRPSSRFEGGFPLLVLGFCSIFEDRHEDDVSPKHCHPSPA